MHDTLLRHPQESPLEQFERWFAEATEVGVPMLDAGCELMVPWSD
jgi:hypothetical protein